MSESQKGIERRDFLRKAAATGAAAAWAAPIVNTIAATPAFAQTGGTPSQGGCFHSLGMNGGCMGACGGKCGGNQCGGSGGVCTTYCPPGSGNDNPCCNPGLCEPGNFQCSTTGGTATYTGPTTGCT
ncbi:MAG TPA: twin-arginine translocation signal domain-containing protein [Actinomycetota bacterium]|nr:twin-arginine translocation signal domain-containing protein [Actinomycetota bacterium]